MHFNRKYIVAGISLTILLFIAGLLACIQPAEASPDIELFASGAGTSGWSDEEALSGAFSIKLTVVDGTEDEAGVVIPVDIPLKDITSLSFWKMVTAYGASGWNPSVSLGVDADGSGTYDWEDPDDAFLAGESPTGLTDTDDDWVEIDAFADYMWWSSFDPNIYKPLSYYQENPVPGPDDVELEPTDHVKEVIVIIGGSGSWMDETVYVDDLELNGDLLLTEPLAEDVIAALNELKSEISEISAAHFKNPGMQRQNALMNKINAVINQIEEGSYRGAINKLQNDILKKLTTGRSGWLTQAHPELIEKVNAIIEMIEGL